MKEADFAKYVRKNPAPQIDLAGAACAVVIPVFDELDELPGTLRRLFLAAEKFTEKVAVVAVVNEPAGSSDLSSRETLAFLAAEHPCVTALYAPQLSGGVGAARKLGMDAVISASDAASVDDLVIFSLDADTWAAENYFTATVPAVRSSGGAATLGFRHRAGETPEAERAIRRYEAYLHNYVSRLKKAGSPYAFHTVGSAFAVRGDGYIKAGGMRVKAAGEDFYFLQSAAKQCGISETDGILVEPSPRESLRVPFGTGPSMVKLLNGGELDELPDAAFEDLAQIISCAARENMLTDMTKFRSVLPPSAVEFLTSEGFFDIWDGVLKNLPEKQLFRLRAFNNWFDGLKTLKFLHFFMKYSQKSV